MDLYYPTFFSSVIDKMLTDLGSFEINFSNRYRVTSKISKTYFAIIPVILCVLTMSALCIRGDTGYVPKFTVSLENVIYVT